MTTGECVLRWASSCKRLEFAEAQPQATATQVAGQGRSKIGCLLEASAESWPIPATWVLGPAKKFHAAEKVAAAKKSRAVHRLGKRAVIKQVFSFSTTTLWRAIFLSYSH